MNTVRPLDLILKELKEAKDLYEDYRDREDVARKNTIGAINRLNQLQREFELAVGRIQQDAPLDSDWGKLRSVRTHAD